MITIVREGTKRTAICPRCGALLRFDYEKDVNNFSTNILPGCYVGGKGDIICPQCNCEFETEFQLNYKYK